MEFFYTLAIALDCVYTYIDLLLMPLTITDLRQNNTTFKSERGKKVSLIILNIYKVMCEAISRQTVPTIEHQLNTI